MARVLVVILFYILTVVALSTGEAPAPKASKPATPAKVPEVVAKKSAPTKASEAATTDASVSRKSGPTAAPATTSTPSSSMDEASIPPSPSTSAASPATEGLAEGLADADQFGAATLKSGVAMAGVATAVATMIFY